MRRKYILFAILFFSFGFARAQNETFKIFAKNSLVKLRFAISKSKIKNTYLKKLGSDKKVNVAGFNIYKNDSDAIQKIVCYYPNGTAFEVKATLVNDDDNKDDIQELMTLLDKL